MPSSGQTWPREIGDVHKDRLLKLLESDYGLVSRTDDTASRHIFLRTKQNPVEWPFSLNRDGCHFSPLIVCRILERFEIDPLLVIAKLRGVA
jgi:hypothetical protein